MPLIARGIGSGDEVACVAHGAPEPNVCPCCKELKAPLTNECSTDVFVEGFGAVRLGDLMLPHPKNYKLSPEDPLCTPHEPPCNSGSPDVYVNGEPVARELDTYFLVNDHIIQQPTQSTVFANG
jgi:uncharacterized Zn-binding protein involved in type VI secretion